MSVVNKQWIFRSVNSTSLQLILSDQNLYPQPFRTQLYSRMICPPQHPGSGNHRRGQREGFILVLVSHRLATFGFGGRGRP